MAPNANYVSFLNGVKLPYDPAAPGNYTLPNGETLDFGVTPDYLNESRDAAAIAGLTFVFALSLIISSFRISARLATKAPLGFGLDDAILIFTALLYVSFVGVAIPTINLGEGRHIEWIVLQGMIDVHVVTLQEVWDVAMHLLYTTAMYSCRLSALAFFRRLSGHKFIRTGIWVTFAAITAMYLAQMFTLIFHCSPVTALWPYDFQLDSSRFTCHGWGTIYLINAVLSFVSDLAVFVIPACLVYSYKGSRSARMKLALILFPGVLVLGISAGRLGLLAKGFHYSDQSWFYGPMLALESAELGSTMIALSIPALKVFASRSLTLFSRSPRTSFGDDGSTVQPPTGWSQEPLKNPAMAHTSAISSYKYESSQNTSDV